MMKEQKDKGKNKRKASPDPPKRNLRPRPQGIAITQSPSVHTPINETATPSSRGRSTLSRQDGRRTGPRVGPGGYLTGVALPTLEPNRNARYATIDYSSYKAEKMRKVRKVVESKWFPQKREKITEVGTDLYWTVVQKDIAVILEKNNKIRNHKWIDWEAINEFANGTDIRPHFAATRGLTDLLETKPMRWLDNIIFQFYATLWIPDNREYISFMFGSERRRLDREDMSNLLGITLSGDSLHNLAFPTGHRGHADGVPPSLGLIHHMYLDPDAENFNWKVQAQLTREAFVTLCVTRYTILPRKGSTEEISALMGWLLHYLMDDKAIDFIDLMVGEMQDAIKTTNRMLPFAPYIVKMFLNARWIPQLTHDQYPRFIASYKALSAQDKRLRQRAAPPPLDPEADDAMYQDPLPFDHREPHGLFNFRDPLSDVELDDDDDSDPNFDPADDLPPVVPTEKRFRIGTHDSEASNSGMMAAIDRIEKQLEMQHNDHVSLRNFLVTFCGDIRLQQQNLTRAVWTVNDQLNCCWEDVQSLLKKQGKKATNLGRPSGKDEELKKLIPYPHLSRVSPPASDQSPAHSHSYLQRQPASVSAAAVNPIAAQSPSAQLPADPHRPVDTLVSSAPFSSTSALVGRVLDYSPSQTMHFVDREETDLSPLAALDAPVPLHVLPTALTSPVSSEHTVVVLGSPVVDPQPGESVATVQILDDDCVSDAGI